MNRSGLVGGSRIVWRIWVDRRIWIVWRPWFGRRKRVNWNYRIRFQKVVEIPKRVGNMWVEEGAVDVHGAMADFKEVGAVIKENV